jgi:hypothetical protein
VTRISFGLEGDMREKNEMRTSCDSCPQQAPGLANGDFRRLAQLFRINGIIYRNYVRSLAEGSIRPRPNVLPVSPTE